MPIYDTAPAQNWAASAKAPRGRSLLVAGSLFATLLSGIACNPDDALKVPQPDNVTSASIVSLASLPALLAGTQSAFQIAYSGGADEGNGGHEGYVNLTGLFTDEMITMETFPTRILIDGRVATPDNVTLKGYFIDLASARAIADKADGAYNTFAPDSVGHGVALALGAYSYVLFAEGFCEGVPVSTLNANGSITDGMPLSRQQLQEIAVQRFDSAIALARADGDSNTLNMARVGLGRVLIDSNDYADAAAAVAGVPSAFVYDIGASTNSLVENNGIWNYTFGELGFSVSDSEGTNGLQFTDTLTPANNDPRIPVFNTGGTGVDRTLGPFIQQLLYPAQTTPIPLATGIEAQLIIAENQLKTGGGWLATLNALRTTVPGLAPLADPGTPAAEQNLLFRERAFWMYLTGHREGDLRRLIRQYGRAANTVFPIGTDANGAPYGSDVNFSISQDEDNNPNFHGCTKPTTTA
jgi:starch-binding outer membrane protein, SusD/RagB family